MKLSVYDEPGFRNVAGQGWQVLMDGRKLERVFKVDTATGVAWVADVNADGSVKIVGDQVAVRRVLGPMRAVLP